MDPRERCLRAIELEEVDLVPTVFRCRQEVLELLGARLGTSDPDALCLALDVDVRSAPGLGLRSGHVPAEGAEKEGGKAVRVEAGREIRRDVWGIETGWAPDYTYTYSYVRHPLADADPDEYDWPEVDEEGVDRVSAYRRSRERFCVYAGVTHLFEQAWQLVGFNRFLLMMRLRPSEANRILDKIDGIRAQEVELLSEAGVDVVVDGDDVGAQASMIVSPELWRLMLKERYRALIRSAHKAGVKFMFHSDGWIEPIVPDIVEIGVDVLNPVQPEVMNLKLLKEKYGDRLCFEGGISIQRTLPFGTPEDVKDEFTKRIRELGPTGVIPGPTHSIQADTSVDNILALYRACRRPQ